MNTHPTNFRSSFFGNCASIYTCVYDKKNIYKSIWVTRRVCALIVIYSEPEFFFLLFMAYVLFNWHI